MYRVIIFKFRPSFVSLSSEQKHSYGVVKNFAIISAYTLLCSLLVACNLSGEKQYGDYPLLEDTPSAQVGSCLTLDEAGKKLGMCYQLRADETLNGLALEFRSSCQRSGGEYRLFACNDPDLGELYRQLCSEQHEASFYELDEALEVTEVIREVSVVVDYFYERPEVMASCDGDVYILE